MTPEALIAATARVQREWGDYGYRIERVEGSPVSGAVTLHVAHFDGSRFTVAADAYGNPIETEATP